MLILDIYYEDFLARHYAERPALARRPYDEQLAVLMDRSMGTADAYSRGFRAAGHEADEIVVNCLPLQLAWARENGLGRYRLRRAGTHLPSLPGLVARHSLLHAIAMAQIEAFAPDVLYCQDIWFLRRDEVERVRRRGTLVAAQCGSQPPPGDRIEGYDFVATSFPHFVERLRARGVDTEYLPLAFDERVLERLRADGCPARPGEGRDVAVSFVGGIHPPEVHRGGTELLERLAVDLDLQLWGYVRDSLRPDSPIVSRHHGPVWGLDMYRTLARSQVTVNRHGDIAETYANNMRLFEATGVGTLVLTEAADNLPDLFEPGRELVAYDGPDDLVEKARHYLANRDELARIAAAGQAVTLERHTYERRVGELAEMLTARI